MRSLNPISSRVRCMACVAESLAHPLPTPAPKHVDGCPYKPRASREAQQQPADPIKLLTEKLGGRRLGDPRYALMLNGEECRDLLDAARQLRDERDAYVDRLEMEQRAHEETKGYRQHAEQQLASARALSEGERARVTDSVLRELKQLAETKKCVLLVNSNISKEAAWGRAYGQAMGEMLAKYMQEGKTDGT